MHIANRVKMISNINLEDRCNVSRLIHLLSRAGRCDARCNLFFSCVALKPGAFKYRVVYILLLLLKILLVRFFGLLKIHVGASAFHVRRRDGLLLQLF